MLIDTHAHLNFGAFKEDVDDVIKRIREDGMKVINVGSQLSTSRRAVELARKYPDTFYAAVGMHPIHLFELEFDIEEMPFRTHPEEFRSEAYEQLTREPNVVAIGECGIDYFQAPINITKTEFKQKQKWTFLKQLQLAKQVGLPLILHCRGDREDMRRAYHDMLAIIKEFGYYRGVIHCFTADWSVAREFLDLGFMISFTGIITYPQTASLATVVKKAPLDRIMIETDAPYLTPQLVRGQRNEPQFVRYVAARIAEIKGLSYDEVVEETSKNAIEFFNLK